MRTVPLLTCPRDLPKHTSDSSQAASTISWIWQLWRRITPQTSSSSGSQPNRSRRGLEFIDDLEALEIGLEKEYAAYDFYMRVVDTVDDHKTRNLLHELAGEERGYINLLLREIAGRDASAGDDR